MSETHPETELETAVALLRRYNLSGQSASLDADVAAFLRHHTKGGFSFPPAEALPPVNSAVMNTAFRESAAMLLDHAARLITNVNDPNRPLGMNMLWTHPQLPDGWAYVYPEDRPNAPGR